MIVLGCKTAGHDISAALVKDGLIIAASDEERFDRVKHSKNFPLKAIKFCLKEGGVDINQVDIIAIGMDWRKRAKARFDFCLSGERTQAAINKAERFASEDKSRAEVAESIFRKKFGYNGKITFFDHHDCHAAACYFISPFSHSAIITLDGAGEQASTRVYYASETKLKWLLQIDFPNSLGLFYGLITKYLGFKMDSDEGKIMALAAFGDKSLLKSMRKVVSISSDGTYRLNDKYLDLINSGDFSSDFFNLFGLKRNPGENITRRHKNIARATQIILEEAVLQMVELAKKLTREKNLCLGGGVALNSVANGKIIASKKFKNVYIYPASGDNGTSMGAALFAFYRNKKNKIFFDKNLNPYLGYQTSDKEVLRTLTQTKVNYSKPLNIYKEVVNLLSKGKAVGWFYGRAEFGPRALGNRSILADPRDVKNKDRLNKKIKMRESFQPFAPVVLEDITDEYFKNYEAISPYMIMAFKVKKGKEKIIPAVVHIDNTARLQTIRKDQNEKLWNLINEFNKITGVPVLLNTSFNRAGEPIVNTPLEAINTYLNSKLDALVIEDYLMIK